MDELFPVPGEEFSYIGDSYSFLTCGKYYEILDVDYNVVSFYLFLVRDDEGGGTWVESRFFNFTE